jgi:hypothetical protein
LNFFRENLLANRGGLDRVFAALIFDEIAPRTAVLDVFGVVGLKRFGAVAALLRDKTGAGADRLVAARDGGDA